MRAPAPPSLFALWRRFLRFGATAFGGPVAQIGALHDELVVRERWADELRFRRALAVYQALPGPEATELCIWFGSVVRGRLGGLVAGLGFVLPGLVLMLACCWLLLGRAQWPDWLAAAFVGLQAAAIALVWRASRRLADTIVRGDGTLLTIVVLAAVTARGPFWLVLIGGGALAGVLAWLARRGLARVLAGAAVAGTWLLLAAVLTAPGAALLGAANGSVASGDAAPLALLALGLRAGLLTFGGAYTVIPFLAEQAVGDGGFLSAETFVSGVAVGGVLPAPMVIVGTWVGFAGGGLPGALLLTLGIFAPAFVFPLLLHPALERLVLQPRVHAALDGIAAATLGLIVWTAIELTRAAVGGGHGTASAAIGLVALVAVNCWRQRLAVLPIMAAAGLAGFVCC